MFGNHKVTKILEFSTAEHKIFQILASKAFRNKEAFLRPLANPPSSNELSLPAEMN